MTENQKVCDFVFFWLVFVNSLLDLVLEAALGYAGAIGTSLMDELASLNERFDSSVVDIKMEDLDRRIVALVDEGIRDRETVRMMGVETRERSERWNERNVLETQRLEREIESLRTQLSDERRARRDLAVEQVVYSIYHMVLYFLPEGDGWLRLLVVSGSRRERAIGLSHLGVHLYILIR